MIRVQELIDRYKRVESEVDTLGRTFKVGMLTPSQRNRIFEMLGDNPTYTVLPMMRCASVRSVIDPDGQEIVFSLPKDRAEIDSNMDLFDAEGMDAIAKALLRLDPPKAGGEVSTSEDKAKN